MQLTTGDFVYLGACLEGFFSVSYLFYKLSHLPKDPRNSILAYSPCFANFMQKRPIAEKKDMVFHALWVYYICYLQLSLQLILRLFVVVTWASSFLMWRWSVYATNGITVTYHLWYCWCSKYSVSVTLNRPSYSCTHIIHLIDHLICSKITTAAGNMLGSQYPCLWSIPSILAFCILRSVNLLIHLPTWFIASSYVDSKFWCFVIEHG